jgi:hypothetical protein
VILRNNTRIRKLYLLLSSAETVDEPYSALSKQPVPLSGPELGCPSPNFHLGTETDKFSKIYVFCSEYSTRDEASKPSNFLKCTTVRS